MGYEGYRGAQNNLRQCRKERCLTQRDVADHLGLKDRAWISRWESGYILPSLVNAVRLSLLYEVSLENLFPGLIDTLRKERSGRMLAEMIPAEKVSAA